MNTLSAVLAVLIGVMIGMTGIWTLQNSMIRQGETQPTQTTTIVEQPVQPQVQIIEDQPLPYWTQYGLPNYWPVTLSPYWFYDVPFYGPITGYWGGYDGVGLSGGYRGRREKYATHGWGRGYRGYSGVSVGGGGGGGRGGGGGGGHGGGGR